MFRHEPQTCAGAEADATAQAAGDLAVHGLGDDLRMWIDHCAAGLLGMGRRGLGASREGIAG